jgi:integrase
MASTHLFKDLAQVILANYGGQDPSFKSRLSFWIDQFGDRDIASLAPDDIEDGLDALVARGKIKAIRLRDPEKIAATQQNALLVNTQQPLSPSTINRYLASLGTMFRDLRKMRLLPRGFVSPLRGVSRQPEGAGRTIEIDSNQVTHLIAACRLSRNRKLSALVALACTTGWRLGSLQKLKWGDLDLGAGTAYTSRTKNGTPHRTALLPWVIAEIRAIKPTQAPSDGLVFGPTNPNKALKTALMRANLPTEWTFHHCRHIAASVLAQSGASVPIIMACLNHKSPQMALRYSHLNIATLRESLEKAWL